MKIADWDRSRIPMSLGILKTQSRPQEVFYVCLGVRRWFQSVGCARNKLQFQTVLRNLRVISFLRCRFAYGRYPTLDLRDLVTEVLHSSQYHTQSTWKTCSGANTVKYVPTEEGRSRINRSEEFGVTAVDYVTPKAKLSRHNAWLRIF